MCLGRLPVRVFSSSTRLSRVHIYVHILTSIFTYTHTHTHTHMPRVPGCRRPLCKSSLEADPSPYLQLPRNDRAACMANSRDCRQTTQVSAAAAARRVNRVTRRVRASCCAAHTGCYRVRIPIDSTDSPELWKPPILLRCRPAPPDSCAMASWSNSSLILCSMPQV